MTDDEEKLFEVEDPRKIVISLTTDRYNRHIITDHVEMLQKVELIKESIKSPDEIYKDKNYDYRDVYLYEHSDEDLAKYGKYLKTVVDIDGWKGEVTTSYTTDERLFGELKWKK